jgi:hypothetical protein
MKLTARLVARNQLHAALDPSNVLDIAEVRSSRFFADQQECSHEMLCNLTPPPAQSRYPHDGSGAGASVEWAEVAALAAIVPR